MAATGQNWDGVPLRCSPAACSMGRDWLLGFQMPPLSFQVPTTLQECLSCLLPPPSLALSWVLGPDSIQDACLISPHTCFSCSPASGQLCSSPLD